MLTEGAKRMYHWECVAKNFHNPDLSWQICAGWREPTGEIDESAAIHKLDLKQKEQRPNNAVEHLEGKKD